VSSADANSRPTDGQPAERIGRKIGIGLFWLLLCYVIGMSAVSIIPALYWPELAPRPAGVQAEECAARIDALQQELLARAARAVRAGSEQGLQRWLVGWDKRALALSGGCGPLEQAHRDLLRLRRGVGSLLAAYRSDSMPVQQRLRRLLKGLSNLDQSGEPPQG
jgi:hypothetical protein